jgi:hypothetical protein
MIQIGIIESNIAQETIGQGDASHFSAGSIDFVPPGLGNVTVTEVGVVHFDIDKRDSGQYRVAQVHAGQVDVSDAAMGKISTPPPSAVGKEPLVMGM